MAPGAGTRVISNSGTGDVTDNTLLLLHHG